MKNNNIQIIEALIFANDSPLPAKKIKDILQEGTEKEIKELIAQINKKYEDINSPLQIIEVAGGYQIVTRSNYAPWITKLYASRSAHRLTQKALETLAIISYKQEITKQEIESIRGVNADSVIRTLIERDLITVTGRQKAPGSPLLYGTTKYFLEYFGLKDLSNLPKLKEIDELLKSDEKFLESLDQVSLYQMTPEELGIKSMENNKDEEKAEDVDEAKAGTEAKTETEDNDENK
jgi:segregation and condensation protein B